MCVCARARTFPLQVMSPTSRSIMRYVVRATSCGRFVMPATKIEELYTPENYALDVPFIITVVS